MKAPKSTVEILQLLDKSNCRECGLPSCLVFSLAVFKGQKHLCDCPRIDPQISRQYDGDTGAPPKATREMEDDGIAPLQLEIKGLDLAAAAERTGGKYANNRLTIKILGKDFSIDSEGRMYSDIHIKPWVAGPVLHYVLKGRGLTPNGKWVSLRELESGREWDRFFTQRCEKPLKLVADTYPDLFRDLVEIFNGKQALNHYESDVSLVLRPLPKLPILICYWKPEEGMPSTLNLFFDTTAEKNLPMESIFIIGSGLAAMLGKLALRHGGATLPR